MSSTLSDVRDLLRDEPGDGHPRDYVVARLHGRGAAVPAHAAAMHDDQIWGWFLGELDWLFKQMNPAMRTAHAPLFALFEMKTVGLCLRNASLDRGDSRRQLLERSLLSDRLRDVLGARRHVGAIVAGLGDALEGLSASFADLDTRYFEAGLRGCEDALVRLFVESIRDARLIAPVRRFFTLFTDLRNLMALSKHLRWELKGPVILIRGGSLDIKALKNIIVNEDRDALDAIVAAVIGRPVTAADELSLETVLLGALSAELARARRRHGDDWLVTDYIWRRYIHARNLAVRHHAGAAAPERELVA